VITTPEAAVYAANIRRADRACTQAQEALVEEVRAARRAGVSWAGVGEALGVSRQAVWERFAKHVRSAR
jgi:DNA invertase Pin-like site-specific DNA recombinase